jgi:hypothetical protein
MQALSLAELLESIFKEALENKKSVSVLYPTENSQVYEFTRRVMLETQAKLITGSHTFRTKGFHQQLVSEFRGLSGSLTRYRDVAAESLAWQDCDYLVWLDEGWTAPLHKLPIRSAILDVNGVIDIEGFDGFAVLVPASSEESSVSLSKEDKDSRSRKKKVAS